MQQRSLTFTDIRTREYCPVYRGNYRRRNDGKTSRRHVKLRDERRNVSNRLRFELQRNETHDPVLRARHAITQHYTAAMARGENHVGQHHVAVQYPQIERTQQTFLSYRQLAAH